MSSPYDITLAHDTPKIALRILILATVYVLVGRMSLLLSIPPGYSSPIWPAAGISLACLLLWGPRIWPGILIGSALINLSTSFDASTLLSIVRSTSLALNVGLGATLQAILGAYLIRRTININDGLLQSKPIVLFLLLGGPLSCVMSASWSVPTLWLFDRIPGDELLLNWATWWIGDTIGVLLLTPLMFAWLGQPRVIWQQRQTRVAIPLLLTLLLVSLAFLLSSKQEQARIDSEFNERAATLADLLDNTLLKNLEVLYSVQNLFHAIEDIDQERFTIFVQNSLKKHAGLQAISWNPVIPDEQRQQFERTLKTNTGEQAFITEQDAAGQSVTAQTREKYVVVTLIEPQLDNEKTIGFDVYSSPARRLALDEAGRSGKLVITKPIKLVKDTEQGTEQENKQDTEQNTEQNTEQETKQQTSALFFLPVYAKGRVPDTEEERLRLLRGFAVGVFSTSHLLEQAISGMDTPSILVRLADESASDALLGAYAFDKQGKGHVPDITTHPQDKQLPSWSKLFDFGERFWRLTVMATPEYMATHRSWTPWFVLTSGLLFCASLGTFLLILSGRGMLYQRQAQTDWLTGSYNRRFMENIGQQLDLDSAGYAIIMLDLDHFKSINDQWGHQAGDEVLKAVTQWTREQLPKTDYFGRWGGEEFIILTRQIQPDTLNLLARHLCDGIAALNTPPVGRVTASLGVAYKRPGQTCEQVTQEADKALYQAKHNGRNQVVCIWRNAETFPKVELTVPIAA